jgi:hypothetical protein
LFSWLKCHRGAGIALIACSLLIVGSLVAPAFGAPSALSIAKRALRTSKKANKTSSKALRTARKALKKGGARGPAGPGGKDGFGVLLYGSNAVEKVSTGTANITGALCPGGTYPTGGDAGANASASPNGEEPSVVTQQAIAFDASGPFGYYATYDNKTGHDVDVFVDVVCANANAIAPAAASARFGGGRRLSRHSRIFSR